MRKMTFAVLALFVQAISSAASGLAAEFEARNLLIDDQKIVALSMTGTIRRGDYDRLVEVLKSNRAADYFLLYLISPGGDVEEAIKIGRLARRLYLGTSIARTLLVEYRGKMERLWIRHPITGQECDQRCICASACVLIWLGSASRSGNYIGIHRPTFAPEKFANMSASQARREYDAAVEDMRRYLAEMGVTSTFFDLMMSIHSREIVEVSDTSLLDQLRRTETSFDEWLAARCGRISDQDAEREERIRVKRLSREPLTALEREFYRRHQEREIELAKCAHVQRMHAQKEAIKEFLR